MMISPFQLNDTFLGAADSKVLEDIYDKNGIVIYSTDGIKSTVGYDAVTQPFRYTDDLSNVYEPFSSLSSVSSFNTIEKIYDSKGQITQISSYGFSQCTNLKEAKFSKLAYVGQRAFWYDTGLTSMDLTELTDAMDMAFEGCGLTSVYAPKMTYLKNKSFRSMPNLRSFDAPNLTGTNSYSLYSDVMLTSVNIPKIKYIGGSTFNYDRALSSINLHNVQTIPQSVFANCDALTCVTVSSDNENFYLIDKDGEISNSGCVLLDKTNKRLLWCSTTLAPKDLVVPSEITAIGNQAFYKVASVLSIELHNVQYIGGDAFRYTSTTQVYDFSKRTDTTIPTLQNYTAFDHQYAYYQVKVPSSMYDDWVTATNWSMLSSHIVAV